MANLIFAHLHELNESITSICLLIAELNQSITSETSFVKCSFVYLKLLSSLYNLNLVLSKIPLIELSNSKPGKNELLIEILTNSISLEIGKLYFSKNSLIFILII